ncbi:hypothetical protein ADUPG1_011881, partial [Aduncisulcus paluster]
MLFLVTFMLYRHGMENKMAYPVGHPDLSEIDGSKAYGDYYHGHNHSSLLRFLRGEKHIYFNPNLHLPFISPHCLGKFVVSHHSHPNGIKDFDATFTTSDGKKITKEYQMGKMPPEHYFWQEFPIDIENVISCDIHVISSLDGKQEMIFLHGIRFVIDKKQEKEQEAKKEKERKEQIERERKERVIIEQQEQEQAKQRIELMRLDGELKREKELKRAEMKDLMSDFISSTQQRFEELEKKLSDEKEQRVHDKEEFEKELQSKQSQIDSLLSTLSQVQQKSESDRLRLSRELSSVQRELSC